MYSAQRISQPSVKLFLKGQTKIEIYTEISPKDSKEFLKVELKSKEMVALMGLIQGKLTQMP